mmetsp:Transcript_25212/g.28731  ORF Transcript_25212/g.28731 Transcript_25212/m.28731 type:complete len:795 (+) Transcript_25212:282-2666(+)
MTGDIKLEEEKPKDIVEEKKDAIKKCNDDDITKREDNIQSPPPLKDDKEDEGGDKKKEEEEGDDKKDTNNTNESANTTTKDKDSDDEEDKKKKEEDDEATKKKKKELYLNWPLKGIKEPHENDVLYGRGGGTNHHPGNKRYRRKVEGRKLDYVNSKRLDKPLVALEIIKTWRSQEPPGRFLKLDDKTALWMDVGDKKAREKTSQALREKAPEIRRKQEEDELIKAGKDPNAIRMKENMGGNKATRFANGTKERMSHAALMRAHSLGREYVVPGKEFALDGFNWDPSNFDNIPHPPNNYGVPPPGAPGGVYPPGRHTSYGSHGAVPPQFPPSRNGSNVTPVIPHPPTGGDMYHNSSMPHEEQQQRQQSFGSTGSWARLPSGGAPPPPPYGGSPYAMRTNSFGRISREHSLQQNPMNDPSLPPSRPNGYYSSAPPQPHGMPPAYTNSTGSRYGSGNASSDGQQKVDPFALDPALAQSWSQDYAAAANVFGKTPEPWTTEGSGSSHPSSNGSDNLPSKQSNSELPRPGMVKRTTSNLNEDSETKRDLQPGRAVKRATLNRNNSSTSNRLKEQYAPSTVSNSLKRPTALDFGMRSLSISRALDGPDGTIVDNDTIAAKPELLTKGGRTGTIDRIAREIMQSTSRPSPLTQSKRSLTEDMLSNIMEPNSKPVTIAQTGRSLTEDIWEMERQEQEEQQESVTINKPSLSRPMMKKPSALTFAGRGSTAEILAPIGDVPVVPNKRSSFRKANEQDPPPSLVSRPPSIRTEGRLSTAEYFNVMNEPLGQDDSGTNRSHWLGA